MKTQRGNRVIFCSKDNHSNGRNLALAEPVLRNFVKNKNYDINDIIELYQIKLCVDNDIFLTTWSEEDIVEFKETIKCIWGTVCNFCNTINDTNILGLFNTLDASIQSSFWDLVELLKIYKNISKINFNKLLNDPQVWTRSVLHQKKLVNYFGIPIKDYLLNYKKAAELLLKQYEEKHLGGHTPLYFPNCLTFEDKDLIFLKYLESEEANLNYVRLIVNSNSPDLRISPRTKLKAHKIERKKNNEILEEGFTWECGNDISFSKKQKEPVKESWENTIQKLSYSTQWIEKHWDDYSLFYNFSILFKYTDLFGNITLVSKDKELDGIEKILMSSKSGYLKGMKFRRKSNVSHLQLLLYSHYLEAMNSGIEEVILNFVKEHINNKFGLKDLRIAFPSKNSSYLEKVRLIAPELEYLLKQYKLYVEDGIIEHELLQISSTPCGYKDIPSLFKTKYVYGIGDEFLMLKYSFFSEQSLLCYIEGYENKYKNLYNLLMNENIGIANFEEYQKDHLDKLIEDGYLSVDSDGFVGIKELAIVSIIGRLFLDEVISYWNFPENIRFAIDKMEKKGLVYFGSTLFSEPETKYFNYYLNKSEFTNGLDLRNKYAHGTNGISNKNHRNVYYIFLKLLILIILKIEDDLVLKHKFN